MIDIKLVLQQPDYVAEELSKKGIDKSEIYKLSDLLVCRNSLLAEVEDMRSESNKIASSVKELYSIKGTDTSKIEELKLKATNLKVFLKQKEDELKQLNDDVSYIHMRLPNFPNPMSPIGSSEEDNVIIRIENYDEAKYKDKTFKPHWELAENLDILDLKRASKISGSMFAVFKNDGSRLLKALVDLALEINRDEYQEITPPHFVNSSTFTGTGHLPKFAVDAYGLKDDDLWAIPTGEVPLTGLHRDEILAAEDLPKKYMAYTVCFRREAGTYGKDTRGLQRLHEFHKVELLKIAEKENCWNEFEKMLANAEKILQMLQLPYRIVNLCTGDLTFSSSLIYDIEVYAAGLDKWLEVSSVGIFTDFQARRSNIRYRKDGELHFPHILNGSAIAIPRVWAAIAENYQNADGSIAVPEVLKKYMKKDVID